MNWAGYLLIVPATLPALFGTAMATGCGKGEDQAANDVAEKAESEDYSPGPLEIPLEVTNSIGMKFCLVPAGSFVMGSDGKDPRESPAHRVEITRAFYIGIYEVTQAQYDAVMDSNPSKFKGSSRPVDHVTWSEAVEFCRRLSQKEDRIYRLPTEAEWEYAARAGTATEYYWGEDFDGDYAWHWDNSGDQTHTVGQKLPNALGLYDVCGNVFEFCSDFFSESYYGNSPVKDPDGPAEGEFRVVRGGSWVNDPREMRMSSRGLIAPDYRHSYYGFRCVMEVGNPKQE